MATTAIGDGTRAGAVARVRAGLRDGTFWTRLAERVAVASESQNPDSAPALGAYLAGQIGPALDRLGVTWSIHDNPLPGAGPILVGERREADELPTVLTYGHGDVVLGMADRWRDGLEPWRTVREGERVYGRGTADNKGQHSVNLAALEAVLAERGRLGFNIRFLFETGEEIGSRGLREFCTTHRDALTADVLIASDGPRLAPNRATLFLGARGTANYRFTLKFRDGAHHSGNWGGLLANPGIVLTHALATMVDRRGRILVPDLLPPPIPNSVRRALADCVVEGGPDAPAIDPDWGEPSLTPWERVFGWNTFEILAFGVGDAANPVNAIPGEATAVAQIRFVAGSEHAKFLPAMRRHLAEQGYEAIEVEALRDAMMATRTDPDHPWVRRVRDSIEATLGHPPALLPNLGGSLPNDVFSDILGMPTIWIPHSYSACSQHAPNEHALVPILEEGLELMAGLFWDIGDMSRKSVPV